MAKLSIKKVLEIARSMEGVTEKDHFGGVAFVANGKIFATVWSKTNTVNLMLNLEQQTQLLSIDGEGFFALNNAWGRKGATCVQLEFVEKSDFEDALELALYNTKKKIKKS
ncbi:MAG: MmcQ/YjbR family DNA-binding protein [Pseudobdellovibrio sp.]